MDQRLELDKATINPPLLGEELKEAGIDRAKLRISHTDTTVFVEFDDAIIDLGLVQTVIAAHDYTQLSYNQKKRNERTGALAGIADRYSGFEGDDFLTIVGKIDQWAVTLNARIDGASTVAQVKAVVQDGFTDVATYLGPLLAYVYILRQRDEG